MAEIGIPKQHKDLRNLVFRQACSNNDLTKVQEMIEQDTALNLDLTRGLLMACVKGSLSIVRYFLETKNIREQLKINDYFEDEKAPLSNRLLIQAYANEQFNIVDYLLFEFKIDINEETKKHLELYEKDLWDRVQKRDLFFEMNAEVNNENKDSPKIKV
jgi:hypothetical protein